MSCLLFLVFFFQDSSTEELYDLSLEDLLTVEIVGATLQPVSYQNVPSAVSVFTSEQINRLGVSNLGELMNLVPGFQVYRSDNTPAGELYSSRGRRVALPGAEILFVMDGIRLEEPRSSGATYFAARIPVAKIERVEFIRGPGGAVYGSNAMMGVVNIVTRSEANEAQVSLGSFSHVQGHLIAHQKVGDVSFDLFGHYQDDDGDEYTLADPDSSGETESDDPVHTASFNVKAQWRKTTFQIQHELVETERFYTVTELDDEFAFTESKFLSFGLEQQFQHGPFSSWLRLSYVRTDTQLAAKVLPPGALAGLSNPASSDPLRLKVDFDNYHEWRGQWNTNWKINTDSSLQFGLERRSLDSPDATAFNNFDLEALVNRTFPITYYGDFSNGTSVQHASKRDITGVYAHYQRRFQERTHLTLAVRFDDFSDIGSQVSPRFGLVHQLNEGHSLKFLYGEAFRAPAENELNLINNPVVLGNADLKPETVQSFDAVWIGRWPGAVLSLGYFENHFDNAIVQTDRGNGILVHANVDQDPTKGVELEISGKAGPNSFFRLTYMNILDKPALAFREADQIASMMVDYRHGKWRGSLLANWHSTREMGVNGNENDRITLDDQWLLFANVEATFGRCNVFLKGSNLLDRDNRTPAQSSGLREGIPARGAEVRAGFRYRY